jgi:hypothetical protein
LRISRRNNLGDGSAIQLQLTTIVCLDNHNVVIKGRYHPVDTTNCADIIAHRGSISERLRSRGSATLGANHEEVKETRKHRERQQLGYQGGIGGSLGNEHCVEPFRSREHRNLNPT